MSNKVSFLYIAQDKFTRITNKIGNSSDKARKKFRKLGNEADKSSRKFKKSSGIFTSGLQKIALAATAFVGIRKFIQVGAEFQASIADLSAITGAAGKDLDILTQKTLKMARVSVTSQAEVAEAIKLVASAKPDLLQNLDALTATTEQVLLLKNAAGIDLASAANITAQGLNIFGVEASKAGEFVNILAAGAKLGSSEIRDTGEAMLLAGPAARAAGLNFVQLNAAIQTVAKGGIKGARAGTALNAILGRLRRQGIDFQKLGLEGAFEAVKKVLDRVTDSTKRAQLEATIFGEEHAKVGLALLNNTRLLGQYEVSLKGTSIAQEQADIRLKTFNKRWERLGILIKDIVIRTFLRLEPILSKQIDNLSKWFDAIDPAQVDSFAESLKGLLQVALFIIDAFKIVAAVFKGVGTAIGEFAGQIATLNFGEGLSTDIREAFSVGGKLFGIFENQKLEGNLGAGQSSRTDINVNLKSPEGAIESVKSRTTGSASGLNVGLNMATAQ